MTGIEFLCEPVPLREVKLGVGDRNVFTTKPPPVSVSCPVEALIESFKSTPCYTAQHVEQGFTAQPSEPQVSEPQDSLTVTV